MYAIRTRLAQRRPYQAIPLHLIAGQLVVMVLMAALSWVVLGKDSIASTLSGSAISLLPALYFACRFLRPRGSRQARQHVSNLYRAQTGKFVLTMALFVIVFVKLPPAHPVLFFSAYAVTCLIPQLLCWRMRAHVTPRRI